MRNNFDEVSDRVHSLAHWGIKGQKWGVRRFQNEDGTLTEEGRLRYYGSDGRITKEGIEYEKKMLADAYKDTLKNGSSSLIKKIEAAVKWENAQKNSQIFKNESEVYSKAFDENISKEDKELLNKFTNDFNSLDKRKCLITAGIEYALNNQDETPSTMENLSDILYNAAQGDDDYYVDRAVEILADEKEYDAAALKQTAKDYEEAGVYARKQAYDYGKQLGLDSTLSSLVGRKAESDKWKDISNVQFLDVFKNEESHKPVDAKVKSLAKELEFLSFPTKFDIKTDDGFVMKSIPRFEYFSNAIQKYGMADKDISEISSSEWKKIREYVNDKVTNDMKNKN